MIARIRDAWEWLIAAALIILGAVAYLTIRSSKPKPKPAEKDTSKADEVAEQIIAAEYRRDLDRTQQDLQRKDAHRRTADRW